MNDDNRKSLKDRFCILVNTKRRLIMKERKLSSWVPVLQVKTCDNHTWLQTDVFRLNLAHDIAADYYDHGVG